MLHQDLHQLHHLPDTMDLSVKVPPPLQAIFHEQAKSIVAIKELQNEVSSLLEFKNVLLQTFPDLQKISSLGLSQLSQDGRGSRLPLVSKQTDPDISDDIPQSWNTVQPNTGSMPRQRKLRKSPEGSSTGSTVVDSGFSTEKDISSSVSTLLSPSTTTKTVYSHPEVRWPVDPARMSMSSPQPDSDELLGLLDVIHRKVVKLRATQLVEAEYEERQQHEGRKVRLTPGLGAIHEHEAANSDNEARASDQTKDRTRRPQQSLVDRILELESDAQSSHSRVSKLESEISLISRQKEILEEQLRAAKHETRGGNKDQSGIIHSVQITTGGAYPGHSLQSTEGSLTRVLSPLSQSESNLKKVGDSSGSVNIEIRQPGADALSRSSETLQYRRQPKVPHTSVVNLRSSSEKLSKGRSVEGLPALLRQRTDSLGGLPLSSRTSTSKMFQTRMTGPPNVHKLPPQLNRVMSMSNDKLSAKSRSVENLYDQRLAMKPSNSEISLQPRAMYLDSSQYKLKSTQSEQVLTKIGRTEKVRLDAVMSPSVVSMPAELARGFRVKPNREKIRQVLSTSSVLELQRQLLTTVMENEVYKSQIARVTDGWNGKIDDFEKINQGLQNSLSQLKDQNELLRLKVEQKSIELEGTRARLRQLERQGTTESAVSRKTGERQEASHPELGSRLGNDNYVKFGPLEQRQTHALGASEPRVTFDLGTAKKTKMLEVPAAKVAVPVDMNNKRQSGSQLPSDAKQRLQEMAGYDVKRNFRKSSSGDPPRPNRLNLSGGGGKYAAMSPPSSPVKTQAPTFNPADLTNHKLSRPSLTRKDSRSSQINSAKSSLMTSNNNNNNNNINNRAKSARESLPRQLVSPVTNTNGHQRTRTPSVERSMTSIKEAEAREASKDVTSSQGRVLPALPSHHLLDNTQPLTSLELKHMGRDTIAGLIAGILQKYTKKGEVLDTSTSCTKYEATASFVEIALADEEHGTAEETSRPVTALRRKESQKSWEAFNHTEEMTKASHTAQSQPLHNNYVSLESLTLPDSLNEFEREQYQSPNLYQDSLTGVEPTLAHLGSPHDVDSLQFAVSPTPHRVSQSPEDSLIEIKQSANKINAAEFFDSITSIDRSKTNSNLSQKRRIIPYCDNSLSSGTSAFTSQDVSFDSKDSSSPSDTDRTPQMIRAGQDSSKLYPDLTLAIHPIRTPPTPKNIPVHPLSRRYQTDDNTVKNSPPPPPYLSQQQQELYASNSNQVRSDVDDEANETKDTTTNIQPPLTPKIQPIKSATERLKWKFLGW